MCQIKVQYNAKYVAKIRMHFKWPSVLYAVKYGRSNREAFLLNVYVKFSNSAKQVEQLMETWRSWRSLTLSMSGAKEWLIMGTSMAMLGQPGVHSTW